MTTHQRTPEPARARTGTDAAAQGADQREIGPARFQRSVAPSARPPVGPALASAALLLLLVIGVPVALILLDGVPGLPTSLPTREQLTATIGGDQLLTVLLWVVWLAWLQFTICVVVELRSGLSGIGLPTRVPLAGPSQRFARTLVASVLLLVTAAGQATALTPDQVSAPHTLSAATSVSSTITAPPAGWDVTAPQAAAPDAAGAVGPGGGATSAGGQEAGATAEQGTVTYQLGDQVLSAEEGEALVGKKVYRVEPPEGRYHDNLWDIAERNLGDGRRYQEIFELNQGRDQPDGHELSLARLIYPEWLLIMPEDAAGVERVTAVVTPAAPPAQAAVQGPADGAAAGDATPGSALGSIVDGAADSGVEGYDGAAGDLDHGRTSGTQAMVGTGLLAAGLLAAIEALRRRRRTAEPSDDAVEVEVALRVGADPDRATRLDRGLRQLAGALRDTGRDLPGVYAAVVDDDTVMLHLAPADQQPPAPWRDEDEGRRWVLTAEDLGPFAGNAPAPFPGLVSVGRDHQGSDVLLDLEAAQGPICVVGDPTAALEVATALAAELATNRWSDHLRVTGVGLPDGLAALDAARYRSVDSLDTVLPQLWTRRADTLGAGVLTGRLRGSGASAWMPEYLVLGHLPSPSTAQQLLELAATAQRSPLGVVCVGELPGARWRLEVDDAGDLTVRLLDVQVRANRLGRDQATAVAELLAAVPSNDATGSTPLALLEHEPVTDRPPVEAPEREVEPADLAAARVRVRVLGRPRVEAPGALDADRIALSTELVVHLALHPEGVHPTVLAAAVWPRGVTAAVREATIARVRGWLGSDDYGTPHLREYEDGRLHLGPGVVVDWDVIRTLLARARTATPAQERRELTEALRLVPGPVLAERPQGRYAWLARVRLERASRDLLVDAAHRLALLCRGDDDPAGARDAATAGLRVAPTEELLWRDLIRAAAALGGTTAVQEVAAELEQSLHVAGVAEVDPSTAGLLAELVPALEPRRDASGTA